MKKLLALLVLATAATSAHAVLPKHHGLYWGAGYGITSYTDDSWNEESHIDTKDNTRKLYAGYWINRIVGIELGYTNYGTIQSCRNSFCASTLDYYVEPRAYSVAANVGYTFNNGLRPFATLGFSALDLSQSKPIFDSDSDLAFRFGFGGEYSPPKIPGLTLRLAWEIDLFDSKEEDDDWWDDDDDWWDDDDDYLSSHLSSAYLGLSYKF